MSKTNAANPNLANQHRMIPVGDWWLFSLWLIFIGGYAFATFLLPAGRQLTAFGDAMQCIVPLFAAGGLLLNARSNNRRINAFWLLMAIGCLMWAGAQLLWTYIEVVKGQQVPNPFYGDVIYFLHAVPMIGALALTPHVETQERQARLGYVDFSMLLLWWVYVYVFAVLPWQFAAPNLAIYDVGYTRLADVEYLVFAGGLVVLAAHARTGWRSKYVQLFGAALLYFLGAHFIDAAIDRNEYATGSLYDLPLVASFVWMGTVGILAHRMPTDNLQVAADPKNNPWPRRIAIAAVVSMPLLGFWAATDDQPESVRHFRIAITFITIIMALGLLLLRQYLIDRHLLGVLSSLENSVDTLQNLQQQMVQREKLASIGQLAAGAAHEINNPLTGILGYAEILSGHGSTNSEQRVMVDKILHLARRIKGLVSNLMSFARELPTERTDLDLNLVIQTASELCELGLLGKNIRIEPHLTRPLPLVRGNSSQLVQVVHNIILNSIDAMKEKGGGVLRITTSARAKYIIIDFVDDGPGIKEPDKVFDPFYTTKPVGNGTGLGLSICYGIVAAHDGNISCHNPPGGGAAFHVRLPVISAIPGSSDPTVTLRSNEKDKVSV
ncbi:MAG: HAMP domain-containing sensor histidine kinase [Candidatus Acidiferrales bacterium]